MGFFVNVSNTPSTSWPKGQLASAKYVAKTDQIIDLPFPKISHEFSLAEVHDAARLLLVKILDVGPRKELVVHVMGESSMLFTLVDALHSYRVRTLCSTMEPKIVETILPDGSVSKTEVYEFHRFRDYFYLF